MEIRGSKAVLALILTISLAAVSNMGTLCDYPPNIRYQARYDAERGITLEIPIAEATSFIEVDGNSVL